jgi:hypothetical protein
MYTIAAWESHMIARGVRLTRSSSYPCDFPNHLGIFLSELHFKPERVQYIPHSSLGNKKTLPQPFSL